MKISQNFESGSLISLKNNDWLINQRFAGNVAAQALSLLEKEVKNKTLLSLLKLNNLAEEYIQDNHCSLTFKGYKGFPCGVCISVNNQLVHGIPTDYYLQEGDLVSFDLGTTYNQVIADTAITCIYGEPKEEKHTKLVKATEEALKRGIEAITVGKRAGCIGNAIYKYAESQGFKVIEKYGGHGLSDDTPHTLPFISNKSNENEGIRIQPGLTIAIEPLLTVGNTNTYVDKDGWTVYCQNICAHFEHTVFIHEDSVEIITLRNE